LLFILYEFFGEKPITDLICSTRIVTYRISPGVSFGYFVQNLLFVAEGFEIKNLFKFLILISTNGWIQLFFAGILLKSIGLERLL
jgi:hypothetical protein